MLRREHEVVAEHDPRDAVRRFAAGEHFDVVFCDLMMPFLTGAEVYRRAKALDPGVAKRFVFMTGGVLRTEIVDFLGQVGNERFEKPLSIQSIRNTVRRFVHTERDALP
jgi:two-component system NtrC family sensor kinase